MIARVMEIVRKDLDPQTLGIVEEMLRDGDRLAIIRDAFMEGKDAHAVKMIRDLDPMRRMELLPITCDLRGRDGGYGGYRTGPMGVEPGASFQIIARPQREHFRPRYLILARETAMACDLCDIKVGNRSQFSQSGDIPGEMFAVDVPEAVLDAADTAQEPDATSPIYTLHIGARAVERLPLPIDFEVVREMMDLTIIARNISDRPLARFRGAFIGCTA